MPDATGMATLDLSYEDGAVLPDSAEIWFRPPPGVAVTAQVATSIASTFVPVPDGGAEVVVLARGAPNNMKHTEVVARLQRDDRADAHCLWLTFLPAMGRAILPARWTIKVPAAGPAHGWLDRNNGHLGRWQDAGEVNAGANFTTLGSPSVATRPLTVGSVREAAGIVTPSDFSGRGPARGAAAGTASKPDLAAPGEGITAPFGNPVARSGRQPTVSYKLQVPGGTSYAAPQVAGACALLLEHYGTDPLLGSPATWDDLRQAILGATVRVPNMPAAGPGGWEPVCGHGLLRPGAVQPPPPVGARRLPRSPKGPDLWLARSPEDEGEEPFVAWRFWDSPALVLLDNRGEPLDPVRVAVAAGEAEPAALRLRVRNRGGKEATEAVVAAWWAPLGALHPLPEAVDKPRGAWRAEGFGDRNQVPLPRLPAGEVAEVTLPWRAPRDAEGRILPHQLLGIVSTEADPYAPEQPICATNNLAVLSVAAARRGAPVPPFTILGSFQETDGAILWPEGGDRGLLRIEGLPVTVLPWREAAIFEQAGAQGRPLYDGTVPANDPAARRNAELTGAEIEERTDIRGAGRLALRDGLVTIEGGPKLVLPRLRIAHGAALEIRAMAAEPNVPGSIHLLHLSGGRRVGGGTFRVLPR
jgi:Subtilase family